MKKKKISKKRTRPTDKKQNAGDELVPDLQNADKRFDWVCMVILLVTGIYLSYVFFGQKAVPNSDFTAFVKTGNHILHFQVPASFKRVPMLGILQILTGKFMFTSPYPVLSGALVLNGILYTLSILLFYKICRYYLEPTGSFCLSFIAALNPWSILMLVDPIAETALVFFVLLTFFLLFKRSWWCYLAAVGASMTRYEGVMLIGIVFLFDLWQRKPKREKLKALGLAFAAAIPMLLWIIGTKMTTADPDSHYFRVFFDVEQRNSWALLKKLWQTSYSSLIQWPEWIHAMLVERPTSRQAANAIQAHHRHFLTVLNVVTTVFFVLGVVWLFLKKHWLLLSVLFFWIGYVSIHMAQSVLLDRYTMPMIWLTLLVTVYGMTCSVVWLAGRIPKNFLSVVAILGALAALLWIIKLGPAISKTAQVSAASSHVVYVGLFLVFLLFAAKQYVYQHKAIVSDLCLFFMIALLVVSNQFTLAFQAGQGDLDIEFRQLAEWYLENTDQNEKLATTLPGVVNLFLPQGQKKAIHTGGIEGENIFEFAHSCHKKKVRYVAWDSRLGFAVKGEYYEMWGLKKIHPLGGGRDVGPFKFLKKIEANKRRYILLYRLDDRDLLIKNP